MVRAVIKGPESKPEGTILKLYLKIFFKVKFRLFAFVINSICMIRFCLQIPMTCYIHIYVHKPCFYLLAWVYFIVKKGLTKKRKKAKKKRKKKVYVCMCFNHTPVASRQAPCHKALVAMVALRDCRFEELSHPPYSPYLALSDFHLF